MASKTFYPTSITQASSTTTNHYKQWGDLANLKTSSGSARCGPRGVSNAYIAGKNGTYRRPSALTIKGFDFSDIPNNADINSIVIEYAQHKGAYNEAYPSFTGPVFTVNGNGKKITTKTGATVTSTSTSHSFTVTGLTRTSLNNFNIKVDYPTNGNTNPGYVYLNYVRVKVNYTTPTYSVDATIQSDDIRLDDKFNATFLITNTNKTSYNPNANIVLPTGLTFTGKYAGNGTITTNGNVLTWKTGLNKTTLQNKITLELQATTVGSKTLSVSESVSGSSKTVSVNVRNKPLSVSVTGPTSNLVKSDETITSKVSVVSEEAFTNTDSIDILVNGISNTVSFLEDSETITITGEEYTDSDGVVWTKYAYIPNVSQTLTHDLEVTITPTSNVGLLNLRINTLNETFNYKVNVYPSSIEQPYYTGFIVTDNERSKLCDEQLYEVSSNLFIEDTHNPPYYSDGLIDYGLNHRICVFNEDPYILVTDPNGHTSSWQNIRFIVDTSKDDKTTLTFDNYSCFHYNNTYLEEGSDWSVKFEYIHNDGTNLNDIGIRFYQNESLNKLISFNRMGLTEVTNEKVTFELKYVEGILYVFIDETTICLFDDLPNFTDDYRVGFYATSGSITYKNFSIRQENVTKTPEELITYAYEHCTIKSDCPEQSNTWTKCSTTFTYNEDYPVIILILGEPLSSSLHPSEINLKFTNPCIQEVTSDVMNYQETGNFPEEFINIISEDVSATVTGESNTFVLSDWINLENIGTNEDIVVTGLEFSFDYPNKDDVSLLATVKSNGVIGNRSLIISADDEEPNVILGDEYDRWDLSFNSLTNLQDLEVHLKTDGGVFNIQNPKLIIHYNEIPKTEHTCWINGEDTRYYGVVFKDIKIPAGINTSTNYLTVEGTDSKVAYRQNLNSKDLTLDFSVWTNDLVESGKVLQQITKLFVNERDSLNKPIPKTIRFSHYPNEVFDYIIEGSIDNSVVITDYENCTATLTVPSGTSRSIEEIITSLTGANKGLVKVNPLIKVKNLTSEITVIENFDKNNVQNFIIRDTDVVDEEGNHVSFTENDYLEIDCTNRNVTLYKYDAVNENHKAINATVGVDFASDWFLLYGEYAFNCTGAKIDSISYYERW